MDLYLVRKQLNMGIPITNIKLRVTDYSRVSTMDIKQHNSLKNQTEYFDEMIKKNANWTYIDGYVDEGITGTSDTKRNSFMRMIKDAKEGKFDLIITKEISRFSRNTLDSIKYTRELLSYGVAVLFMNDNINTAFSDSELRLTIMASMAQDEVRRLSERVKFGMHRSIMKGNILGNSRLYGYIKDKITGNLVIDEEQAEIIRKIYDMYLINDFSLSRIVKELRKQNIKTLANKDFSVSTLSRMIRNPKYKGYYCGKKSEVVDYMTKRIKYFEMNDWIMYEDKEKVPPIVGEEIWEMAFDKLNSRSKSFIRNVKTLKKEDEFAYYFHYPLSSKIFCSCHNTIFYRRKLSKNSNEIVWCCSKYLSEGKKTCDISFIRQSELYSIFNDIMVKLSIDIEDVKNLLLDIYKSNINMNNSSKYVNKIKLLEKKKDKLFELNVQGIISNLEFMERNNKYNLEIYNLYKKIKDLSNNKYNYKNVKKALCDEKIIKLVKERLIRLLLDKVIVFNIDKGNNYIGLKMFFNISETFIRMFDMDLISYNKQFVRFLTKHYEFCRGYDKTCTKRYNVKYKISCYVSS
ncbi:MAG: recombinase family protein [Bacilli bacterium]|nr:recombinase family protein [Bacilli bacterium]